MTETITKQLADALRDARAYVVHAYECAFPDEDENMRVLNALDDAIAKFDAAGTAAQEQPGITDEQILAMNRAAQDQGVTGIHPAIHLVRAALAAQPHAPAPASQAAWALSALAAAGHVPQSKVDEALALAAKQSDLPAQEIPSDSEDREARCSAAHVCDCQDAGMPCARLETAHRALHDITEEWAGAECGEPQHAQEAYAIGLAKRMYELAKGGLSIDASPAAQGTEGGA